MWHTGLSHPSKALLVLVGLFALLAGPALAQVPTVEGDAEEAIYDPAYFPPGYVHEFALYICTADHNCDPAQLTPDPGVDFVFEPSGNWVEYDDGTARLTATAVDRSDPQKTFAVDVTFSGRTEVAPPGSPKKELIPEAYVDQGGPVDPATWYYYTSLQGTFTGGGLYDGAVIEVMRIGPAFQFGPGANGKNTHNGGSGWLQCDVVSQPTTGETIAEVEACDINIDLDVARCPDAAEADATYALFEGGHVFSLPGIGDDFLFDAGGADFIELADGTGRLLGTVRSVSEPGLAFLVDVLLTGHTAVPPAGSPVKELDPSAYVENGGPVDAATWRYYTGFAGTLTGLQALDGAVLQLGDGAPVFQIGDGANGRNLRLGASKTFSWTVASQPTLSDPLPDGTGDLNLDLGYCGPIRRFPFCLSEAERDIYNTNGNHAVAMPGIARDFIFAAPATWYEYEDGTAHFDAVIHEIDDPTKVFNISVDLSGRTDVAPPGSPKKELPASAYAPNGPADPSTWWYYPNWSATFIGQGSYAGAELTLTRRGPSFQVGIGANNKNVHFGASAWFDYHTVSQPDAGMTFPSNGRGDFNLDLECPPDDGGDGGGDGGGSDVPDVPAGGCVAAQVVSYDPGPTAGGGAVEPQRADPTKALGTPEGGDWINFVTLGFGGALELDFGARVMNVAGDDVTVFETSFGDPACGDFPEQVRVWASQDGDSWQHLGSRCLDGAFDLGTLPWARYFRLVDDSDAGDFSGNADGYDVDGLIAEACQPDTPEPPAGPSFIKLTVGAPFGGEARIAEVEWFDRHGREIRVDVGAVTSNQPYPRYAVDGLATTYWSAGRSARDLGELTFDLSHLDAETPTGVRILPFGGSVLRDGEAVPLTFSVAISDDGEQWREIYRVDNVQPGRTDGGGLVFTFGSIF
jgi:hypothetical protein